MGQGRLGAGWVDIVGPFQPMKHIRPISIYIWLDGIYSLQFSIKIYFITNLVIFILYHRC